MAVCVEDGQPFQVVGWKPSDDVPPDREEHSRSD
jgi:hypothetical protein